MAATTCIIDPRFMPPALSAVPPRLRRAAANAADYLWDREETDYLDNCSNEPGGNLRAGHIFEDLSLLRQWLEGCVDGQHVSTVVEVTNPVPAPGGYHTIITARRKTVGEVRDEIVALIGVPDYYDDGTKTGFVTVPGADEYFGVYAGCKDTEWPAGRIVVFAVTGGCEGWYVHVEVQTAGGESRLMILGKGFDSADASWALARRLADILGV